MKKKAFITGISGQDGSYLAELLLEKGYEVHGIVRRNSVPENQWCRIEYLNYPSTEHLNKEIEVEYGDLSDTSSLNRILSIVILSFQCSLTLFKAIYILPNLLNTFG